MSNIGIALNLFPLRDLAADDLPDALQRVKQAGFDYVEWAGMPDLPAAELRSLLDKTGLKVVGGHSPLAWFIENPEGAIAFWECLGAPDVSATGLVLEGWQDPARLDNALAQLDELAQRLAMSGLRLGYAHHGHELENWPGQEHPILARIVDAIPADHLVLELDTGWLGARGLDPAAWIREAAGRAPLLVLNDFTAPMPTPEHPQFCPPGEGQLDWDTVFDAGEEAAAEWYICRPPLSADDPDATLREAYAFFAEHA